jgi:cob(I)alamin adenosyltransferase
VVFANLVSKVERAIRETEEICKQDNSRLQEIPSQLAALVTKELRQCTEEFITERERAIDVLEQNCRDLEKKILEVEEQITFYRNRELRKRKKQECLLREINQLYFSDSSFAPIKQLNDLKDQLGKTDHPEEIQRQWVECLSNIQNHLQVIEERPEFGRLHNALARTIANIEGQITDLEAEQRKIRDELPKAKAFIEGLTKGLETSRQFLANEMAQRKKDLEELGVYTHDLTANLFAGFGDFAPVDRCS